MKKIIIINLFVLLSINIVFNFLKNKKMDRNSQCRNHFYKLGNTVKEDENEYFLHSYKILKSKNVKLFYFNKEKSQFVEVETPKEIGEVLMKIIEKNRDERINEKNKEKIVRNTFFSNNENDNAEYFIEMSDKNKERIILNNKKYYFIKNRCELIEILSGK